MKSVIVAKSEMQTVFDKDGQAFAATGLIARPWVEDFNLGDMVSVTGISKGKGFAGVVKRWHFKGGPRTHGQSDRERAPGSSGPTTTPGKVHKGSRRPGRMGSEKVTVKNLEILKVDSEANFIWVKGAVPGRKGAFLVISKI
ncbi:50S ribosomal protein L3 [Candidatus Shapirobacteria bacterium CG03_land_8_20_14_0_80_40_19]|uniref:50S ribosomal protein L3 n=4 Tax=Candidatus Shapironibacteriota TaxID=1752721 RepID=A0A2M7BDX8_9BACT|nr:MAG: 50S ribosomal protein L3 [Candidatus Shapirobacteria bacterium CG11_big_fil_rev_8_21_14_0_20_40_12]PIV01315.1 MAG: 50S ribosomal protein L3 [Candidatus Shapirobacteria bacterium CG03_land_8_20_14_0_80_40_19]PJC29191.1 MAG: 50S ribosomal protein L3 [Candidatus Shapirobacteria bacterium CG_4_9_14_0_2_um_filter_40_11]PJC76650.1 MAG: 50S ribosomal protein L3 [Candidatus Shapirobacteria bacterium CG_4_8_14_3_um_filter_39_11]